jgi:hypothetical protein
MPFDLPEGLEVVVELEIAEAGPVAAIDQG